MTKIINIKDIRNGVINGTFRQLVETKDEVTLTKIERLYTGDIHEGREAICLAVNFTMELGYNVQIEPGIYMERNSRVQPNPSEPEKVVLAHLLHPFIIFKHDLNILIPKDVNKVILTYGKEQVELNIVIPPAYSTCDEPVLFYNKLGEFYNVQNFRGFKLIGRIADFKNEEYATLSTEDGIVLSEKIILNHVAQTVYNK